MTEQTTYLEAMAHAMRRDESISEIVTEFAVDGDTFRCSILRGHSEASDEIVRAEGESVEDNVRTPVEVSHATVPSDVAVTTLPNSRAKKGPGF